MPSEAIQKSSAFFRDGKFLISMRLMAILFFFTIFFMPDYFGLSIGFALNTQRILLVIIWIWILSIHHRRNQMLAVIINNRTITAILIYMFVSVYTGLYRLDVGSILNPTIDYFMVYFTTIYFLKSDLSEETLMKEILFLTYVLCFLGVVEYIVKKPLFGELETIEGMFSGAYYRDGTYRIMGPAHHALGYGLFLLLMCPLSCYNYKEKKLDLLERPILLLLIMLNIYLTSARSALGIMGAELVALFLLSAKKEKQRYLVLGGCLLAMVLLLMVMFFNTSPVQKIITMVISSVDGALGTNLNEQLFGIHSAQLEDSAQYRKYLPLIFGLDWLNPYVGRGTKYKLSLYIYGYLIQSIDNFYINQYVKLAYPGLATTIVLILANVRFVFSGMMISRDPFYKVLMVAFFAYFLNLWFADSLGTLDYVFVLFGMMYVHYTKEEAVLKQKLAARSHAGKV